MKSSFKRWIPRDKSTWPFQSFSQYSLELGKQLQAHKAASKKAYNILGLKNAKWEDNVETHFQFSPSKKAAIFSDLKDWSNAHNAFDNWVNLNSLVFSSSNLETYMATAIRLALESDPGLIFGSSKVIDGVILLKQQQIYKYEFDVEIMNCTKGDWQSRISGFEKLFGHVPAKIIDNISELETVRRLRNNVAHAIGRDIEDSRIHGVKKVLPIEKISNGRTNKYHTIIRQVAKSIDELLLRNHIGEYQAIYFYHSIYPDLRQDIHPSQRAIIFKKGIGRICKTTRSKDYCKELVKYYEAV